MVGEGLGLGEVPVVGGCDGLFILTTNVVSFTTYGNSTSIGCTSKDGRTPRRMAIERIGGRGKNTVVCCALPSSPGLGCIGTICRVGPNIRTSTETSCCISSLIIRKLRHKNLRRIGLCSINCNRITSTPMVISVSTGAPTFRRVYRALRCSGAFSKMGIGFRGAAGTGMDVKILGGRPSNG